MAKQKILLVDDHEVVRLGLKSLLERHPQFEVVGEAGSAREALEQVAALKPDVVLDGHPPARHLRHRSLRGDRQQVPRHPGHHADLLRRGRDALLGHSGRRLRLHPQADRQQDLIRALEAVSRGEALLDPAVTQRVFQEVRRAVKEEEASAFAHLSQQEKHVLLLVSEGKTNREIAKLLFLGEGTVRNYVSSILSKLGVNNRAEAAAYAVEHSLREYISN